MIRLLLFLAALLLPFVPAQAHELQPGLLEIRAEGPEDYALRFKVPSRGELRLGLYLQLPESCRDRLPPRRSNSGNGFVDSLAVSCAGGLAGQEVRIDGLSATLTDVVVRVEQTNGAVQTALLSPERPGFTVAAAPRWIDTARSYFVLGVEHILLGIDHLLFVLALLLLIEGWARLVAAVTAFTAAHSITLAAAALGVVDLPGPPVEAVIALSIVFLARELLRPPEAPPSLTRRQPWIVAFAFGLLHGLGFAGALRDIGLPEQDIATALLTFNLGVEAGQLLFIAAVLGLLWLGRRLPLPALSLRLPLVYVIGGTASLWLFERVAGFWA